MVFGGALPPFGNNNNNDDDNGENNNNANPAARLQAMRAANCIKVLGKGVIKVVHRVDDARENCSLGKRQRK